ncbi:MAG: M48 family metalloprotease [Bryobacter sp.]|nr:M48 family metalloprotease [Bryobacter sp.]
MSIAAGLPIPDVYLLDEETGINAFAAGHDPADAVIGVTFGALKLLNRDELQGVIAHEFSHILNGDMRLNLRLMGWLHGLLGLVILGRVLTLRFARRSGSAAGPTGDRPGPWPVFHPAFLPVYVLGGTCLVAGSFGAFFARLIKAAVSRQREYLADAAAVQFTRNPSGLAGALVKIGGLGRRSAMSAARAEEASHMYFSEGMSPGWFRFTFTHPPLLKRIERINPYFDGKYPHVSLERVLRESRITELYREQGGGKPLDFEKMAAVLGPVAAVQEALYAKAARETGGIRSRSAPDASSRPAHFSPDHIEYASRCLGLIPESIRTAARQPFSAVALVYGMVASRDPETRARQVEEIGQASEQGIATEMERLLPFIDELDARTFLPLADLCVRALRQLSASQYATFRDNLQRLVEEDRQINLFEYMLQRMVVQHLDPHFRKVKRPPVQYYALKLLLPDCAILLSGLARLGQDSEEEAERAFQRGAAELPEDPALRFLPFNDCNLPQMDGALSNAAQATPALKQQILNALTRTAATDGQLTTREAELLLAMADALGLPIPPFLRMAQEPD